MRKLTMNKAPKPDEDRDLELPEGAGHLTLGDGWEVIQCGEYGNFVSSADNVTFAMTLRRNAATDG